MFVFLFTKTKWNRVVVIVCLNVCRSKRRGTRWNEQNNTICYTDVFLATISLEAPSGGLWMTLNAMNGSAIRRGADASTWESAFLCARCDLRFFFLPVAKPLHNRHKHTQWRKKNFFFSPSPIFRAVAVDNLEAESNALWPCQSLSGSLTPPLLLLIPLETVGLCLAKKIQMNHGIASMEFMERPSHRKWMIGSEWMTGQDQKVTAHRYIVVRKVCTNQWAR